MRALLALFLLTLFAHAATGAPMPCADANTPALSASPQQDAPVYRLKPGEFPPLHSARSISGELVEADYIHRSGVFRSDLNGQLMSFTLLPFGSVSYLDSDADLRDVPLGTQFDFFLYPDVKGILSQVALMKDNYTEIAQQGSRYELVEVDAQAGTILVVPHTTWNPDSEAVRKGLAEPDAAPEELLVDSRTRVWKGDKQGNLSDLTKGDWLLCNMTYTVPDRRRRCTDIWVGVETQKRATEQKRKRHFAFLKERGLPAWIDRVDGDKLTVTLFSGDPGFLQALFQQEGIDPAQWAKEHRRVSVAVANEHLRTYLPNVTNKGATVQEFHSIPTNRYGCSGVRLVIQPELMLEGYRKGHIVRLFAPSWPVEAMPFGEGLYAGGHDEEPADSKELLSADFPYRTDFGNDNLPWYQLQPGVFPPERSEHRVGGELVKINADGRSGQFRMDRTGETVDFTLPDVGKVRYLNAEGTLKDLPLGMRCLFFLYQDEKGAFTRAAVVEDEFSFLAESTVTYRVDSIDAKAGKLVVIRHAAPVKVDYVLEPRVSTDLGRIELEFDVSTRVWKGDRLIPLSDLAVGDELLVNRAARTQTSQGRCIDIWAGAEAQRFATEQQRKRHTVILKAHASSE